MAGNLEEAEMQAETQTPSPFPHIVARIRKGELDAQQSLYGALRKGLLWLAERRLRFRCGGAEDLVEDTLYAVYVAIRENVLKDPFAVQQYARTVLLHMIGRQIEVSGRLCYCADDRITEHADPEMTPEEAIDRNQRVDLLRRSLDRLPGRAKTILVRFYVDEKPQYEICAELGLTETQFRLIKSRAKRRLLKEARRLMLERGLNRRAVELSVPA